MRSCVIFMLIFLTFWSVTPYCQAGTVEQTEREISHLLSFIEGSGCSFNRNGTLYTSPKARQHIQKKYDYIKKKVHSAEDFIKYAATKSSITGIRYQVRCGNASMKSSDWLLEELSIFRTTESHQSPPPSN